MTSLWHGHDIGTSQQSLLPLTRLGIPYQPWICTFQTKNVLPLLGEGAVQFDQPPAIWLVVKLSLSDTRVFTLPAIIWSSAPVFPCEVQFFVTSLTFVQPVCIPFDPNPKSKFYVGVFRPKLLAETCRSVSWMVVRSCQLSELPEYTWSQGPIQETSVKCGEMPSMKG